MNLRWNLATQQYLDEGESRRSTADEKQAGACAVQAANQPGNA
jgi:hypothetical protein